MARLLITISDIFQIGTYGLALLPGIVPQGEERFRIGDSLLLRRPDGSTVQTSIGGIESPNPNIDYGIFILLKGLALDDIPVGTEVWSVGPTDT